VGGSNIILQNIHITELNPQYVWGGDAITLEGSDMVWIDHVKVREVSKFAKKIYSSHPFNRLL
jgi:pectin lyase